MIRSFSALLLASTAIIPFHVQAQSLPSGGSVMAGSAEIGSTSGKSLSIRQNSDAAIINWQSFRIDEGSRVDIAQPNTTSVLLNRVTGDATTTIGGQLNANGRVFIINPNGILITGTGAVNATGFVASTLDISDADFMAGRYNLAGSGGNVVNAGRIEIARGGYAALLGGEVRNSGLILAPLGKVAMGAGTRATLDFSSDGFLKIAMGADQSAALDMSGRIGADGGSVILSAAQARNAARSTVNLSGLVEARGVESRGGTVVLTGGDIALTGATIDVSGQRGGGSVKIGGDRQGIGPTPHADTLSVDAATTIRADATVAGAGGDVVLWSDRATAFAGMISARGIGSKGGEAEVSSKGWLAYAGKTDLTGSTFGTLLLDPYNITISNAPSSGMAGFVANANDSVLNAAVLTAALATANVTVTTGSSGTQAGNITVAAPLIWSSNATLTLQAANNISLNAPITARSGGLTLSAGGTISQTGAIAIGSFRQASGDFRTIGATLPGLAAGSFTIDGGSFLRALGGNGTVATPWLLTDIYGVQGMTSLRTSHFALANDIDASATVNWDGGAGFRPIGGESGSLGSTDFSGSLDGGGHAIQNLYINQPYYRNTGLFTTLRGATVRNLRLTGERVLANPLMADGRAAGLAELISGSVVDNVHIEGEIGGPNTAYAGGLATRIYNNSVITNVSVSGSITSRNRAGGLTEQVVASTVNNVYITASVSAPWVGGVAATSDTGAMINNAWVSGALSPGAMGISRLNAGTIGTSVFWDVDTTGTTTGVGSNVSGAIDGSVGLTTAQARTQAAYTGFDFTNTWFQTADMRPILRSEAATAGTDGYIPVATLNQLQLISANLAANYRLAKDIDATATNGAAASGIWGSGGFVPIGLGSSFSGNFDGGYHAISNLTINRPGTDNVGLFSRQTNANLVGISNLRLINVAVTGGRYTGGAVGNADWLVSNVWVTGSVTGAESTGGVTGWASGGTLSNLHFDGAVQGVEGVGGVVGETYAQSRNLSAAGSVSGDRLVGGIAGRVSNNVTLRDSFSTSSVRATSYDAGGIAGQFLGGLITNVWSSGSVTSPASGGGLVGYQFGGTISNAYWDTQTSGRSVAVGQIGSGSRIAVTGLTTAQARNRASYANFVNFDSVWYQGADMRPILRGEAVTTNDGITGVFNARQLQLINANLSGSYTLLDDVDLSATSSTAGSAGIWGASGWVPLGTDGTGKVWGGSDFRSIGTITSGTYGFTGALYGNGYRVTNLTINRPTIKNVGLFGVTAGTIDGVTVAGSVTGASGVGGLAGMQKSGAISDSTSAVTVVGNTLVGGLVGNQVATSTIVKSSASGSATGTDDVGGLVGYAAGTIDRSFATGTATGTHYVGGLVGYLYRGSVSNTYATGSASASEHTAGGLLGKQDGGTVADSYATGAVTSPAGAGGLIGQIISGGTVTRSYWDTTTSGQATSAGGTGRTTAQMQDPDTYAGWDARAWKIAAPSYPTLNDARRNDDDE